MKPKEAFEILRDTPIDIRSAREDDIHSLYATAQNMALDALERQMWIPCSERLPEELVPVNITWTNREPSFYYRDIKDKPFTATAVYCNEKWFWWSSICEDVLAEYGRNDAEIVADIVAEVDEDVEILAWMPLPPAALIPPAKRS